MTRCGLKQRAALDGSRFPYCADGRAMARLGRSWLSQAGGRAASLPTCRPQAATDSHSARLGPGWLSV